jgi:non-specific serine/threonine protein kinase
MLALELREEPGRAMTETLTSALRPKRLLLILDNCEHLVGGCADVAETLLRACPGSTVMATSREVLGAAGEVVWRVPSLSAPAVEAEGPPPLEHLAEYEAVRLFVDRAVAASPGFRLAAENAPAVADICWRLDGIPLAVELAAARVAVLPPEQISARLDDRFALLTQGRRTALPRQQTLRASVEWSYDLLSEKERLLFARLSVLAGGFTLQAAEAVCAGDGIEAREVLDVVTELVAKSLVLAVQTAGEARYHLLETLRQYGAERLAASGQAETTRARHGLFFTALAEEAKPGLEGPDAARWLKQLEREHDNLRAALSWCLQCDVISGFRLASALRRFWQVRGHWDEGGERMDQLLTAGGDVPAELRAEVLLGAAFLAMYRGQYDDARRLDEGPLARRRGDYATARAHYEEALTIFRDLGDRYGESGSLHGLGWVASEQGDLPLARDHYQQALAISEGLGDKAGVGSALNNLAGLLAREGETSEALALWERSLALCREIGDEHGVAVALTNIGRRAVGQGDLGRARDLFEEALAVFRRLGAQRDRAIVLTNLAGVSRREEQYGEAADVYREALPASEETGDPQLTLACVEGIAVLAAHMGRPGQAARLFGAAEATRRHWGLPVVSFGEDRYAQEIEGLRAALTALGPGGEDAFAAAWQSGEWATPEQAIAWAFEALEPDPQSPHQSES